MTTARTFLIPFTISTLTRLPQTMVLPELQRQFDQADVVQRLSLSYGLAAFSDVRVDFLVSQVESLPPAEVANLVTALRQSKAESIAALEDAAERAAVKKQFETSSAAGAAVAASGRSCRCWENVSTAC